MNTKSNAPQTATGISKQRHRKRPVKTTAFGFALTAALLFGRWAWSQSLPQPVLTITPASSNQMLISITNPAPSNYEVWKTPVLGNTIDYPWTIAAVGTNGQSSYLVSMDIYPSEFYQVILDTNAIPLWEAANSTNQSLGILNVLIDSPTNGATLQ
jgi:hypothetical protein